jgi:lysophospholipase L1-like esterase
LLGSVFLSLVICEAAVRVFDLAPRIRRIRTGDENTAFMLSDNPILGYELRPNARYSDRKFSERSMTNSHGQWDIERTYDKPAGTRRILVLGDSVVLSGDVFDIYDTMTMQLEKRLASQGIEVLNFGVTGYCTRAEAELLKVKGIAYDPDLVFVLFVNNDYKNLNLDMTRIHFERPDVAETLFVHSSLFRLLSIKLNLFHFNDQLEVMRVADPRTGDDAEILERHAKSIGSNNVEDGIRLIKELSEEHGFELVLLVWPSFGHDEIVDVETYPGRRRGDPGGVLVIERIAHRYEVPSFRLSDYFRKHFSEVKENSANPSLTPLSYYTVDGMHANSNGCRTAAEAMEYVLRNHTSFLN